MLEKEANWSLSVMLLKGVKAERNILFTSDE
jgi:hypothetical protein